MTRYSYNSLLAYFARCRPAALGMLLAAFFMSGCNWTIPRGEGFHDEMSTWSKSVRQQEKSDGSPLGTSNKALEIERNLGYR
jgi:hypothetical protein